MNEGIDRNALYRQLNEGILHERLHAFQRNLRKNAGLIARFGGLQRVVPLLAGKHVVVVGAGASLERQMPFLKRYQHRGSIAIIAADMALRPLRAAGITPRYVITCETMPVDYFGSLPTEEMHLFAFSCASNINIRRWRGDISFYNWMLHNDAYDPLWETAGTHLGFVATGSIVTTQAVSLALGCGIASLALAGNDMGFSRGYYAKNTAVHGLYGRRLSRFSPFESLDYAAVRRNRDFTIVRDGAEYFTSNQFLTAKLWLEDLFKTQQTPIFDSSVPGCSGGHVRRIELRKYFEMIDGRARR